MFKLLKYMVFSVMAVSLTFVCAKDIMRGETLSDTQVKARWGSEKLDFKKFKEGGVEVRAKMAYSVLKEKSLLGKDVLEIREMLGRPTGYFFSDAHPAYVIELGKSIKDETWQIVLRIDSKYQVKEVFVHKNCCYSDQAL